MGSIAFSRGRLSALMCASAAVASVLLAPGRAAAQTCTINGSLDATDSDQVGRQARNSGVLACPSPTTKGFPGFADSGNQRLYDIYRFTNPAAATTTCFTFTLAWTGTNVMFATANTDGAYDPAYLQGGYIGDVSGTASPLSMGITINPGASVDVIVFAINNGTAASGAYTLSADCSLTVTPNPIGVKLSTSGSFSSAGNSVTFTAVVTGTPGTVPPGTVTFTDRALGATTAQETVLGAGTLTASDMTGGTATYTLATTSLGIGQRYVSAVYNDSGASITTSRSAILQTNKVNPTVSVTTTASPQAFQGALTLTATIANTAPFTPSAAPTGTVIFQDSITGTFVNLNATGITLTPVSGTLNSQAALSIPTLSVGAHPIRAVYTAAATDNNYNSNTPQNPNITQVITTANTTTTVVSSAPTQDVGGSVTFTATVAVNAPGTAAPTLPSGTVQFMDGATVLGTPLLQGASLTATFSTSALTSGSHTITATYQGDGNFNTSTSAAIDQEIDALASSTAVMADSPSQTVGQNVTFTATVTGAGPTPTGVVSFLDGTTVLMSNVMLVGGTATFTTADLLVGTHAITVAYEGDATYAPSTSAAISEVITTAGSMVTLVDMPVGSSSFGDNVTFTATVSTLSGGPVTGTVTFFDGTTQIASVAVASGAASFSTSGLAVGSHTISAQYSGDTNHDPSQGSASHTVNARATNTTLSPSPSPSVFGQPVVLTATVSSAGGVIPTGSVTFRDGATTIGTANVDGTGAASASVSALSVGSHNLAADYVPSNGNFTGSTSAGVMQTVNQAGTTTTASTSASGVLLGQSVTFTATVTAAAPGAGTPSGTVTFSDFGTMIGMGTLNGSGVATLTTSTLTTGLHMVTVQYGGDANFTGSTSSPVQQTIGKLSSTTMLMSAVNPQVVGQLVTVVASVTGSGSTPTGTVTFFDGTTNLGMATLATGQAALTTMNLTVGAHSITANYSGDGNYVLSTSAPLVQNITKAAATVMVVGAPSPSIADQSVTFTATISATAGGVITGSVTFADGGTTLGTASVSAGTASFSVSTLTVGMHTITATYNGDTTHAVALGTTMQTVNAIATTTTLATSVTPTVFGQPTTLTATVAASGSTPAGSVTFRDGTTALGTGTVQVNASGVATLSVSTLAVGSHSLTADFTGISKYAASTSAAVSQTVGKASTTITVATSSSQVLPGATVTFIAAVSVTAPGAGTPTGNVTFMDGTTMLGTAQALSSGFVTLSVSTLSTANHTITATYAGDGSFVGSTSAGLTEMVSPAAVTASLTDTPGGPTYGQTVTFTATMSAASGGTPTGTVTFLEGTTVLGTGTLSASGAATFATHTLVAGSHTITARYEGDSVHAGGSTASASIVLGKRVTATTLTATPNPATMGQTVTLTATTTMSTTPALGGPVSDLVPLDGTVTFLDGTTTIATGTLGSDGTAAVTTSILAVGTHAVTASFEGASDYASSASTAVNEQVTAVVTDGGTEGGVPGDGGAPDSATADAQPDAHATDAGDGAVADAHADGGTAGDAAADSGAGGDGSTKADGGVKATGGGGGCGCVLGGASGSGKGLLGILALAALVMLRRRRPRT